MKKILLLSAAVLSILATASCSKESAGADDVITIINASIAPSRTALGEKDGASWPNYWKAGDQIMVNGVASGALDSGADGKASASFTFSAAIGTPYYAAYPAAAVSDYAAGWATMTLPASQAYVQGSYDPAAFLMCGTSSDASSVVLSPCVGVFRLSLEGTASITKVKLTAAEDAALSGDFLTDFDAGISPLAVNNSVEMVPAAAVTLPADFFICVPAGLEGALKVEVFDSEGGSMSRNATIKSALTAGQVYAPGTLVYTPSYGIEISAEGITSSTAVICWDNAPAAPYTISVYSDAGCSALVASYAVDADNACWSGKSPRFCISGLASGTTYYVKVSNTAQGAESNVLPVTTADFEIVQVSSDPADEGDVILAEDFSELCWDCDMIGAGAGWFPTEAAQAASFKLVDVASYQAATTSSEKQLSSQAGPLASSRLMHWAQGEKPNMYIHPGYIKLVGSKQVTHLVTPALDNIPEGKVATLEVEVTFCRYFSESSGSYTTDRAIVAVQPAGDYNELLGGGTNKLDLSSNIANITLPAETAWNTFKVTLNGVSKGDRLAFGAHKDVTQNEARMNISDIKVTIKELLEPGDLALTLKSVSSSTASFSWNHIGQDAAYDVSKPYTAALYRDAACTDLVVSHDFEADASCWSENSPCFSFGGLEPATTYYLCVTNTEDAIVSAVAEAMTEAFTPVDATTVTDAAAGDVILAEDFSELSATPDELAGAAGFVPSDHRLMNVPSGVNPEGSFVNSENTGNRVFGSGWDISGSRMDNGWGFFGNSSCYSRNGYLRVSSGSGRTHIVTPALSGIPAGKIATIEVTVTACMYKSNDNDVAVFVEEGLEMSKVTSPSDAKYKKYEGASLEGGHGLGISAVKEWETKSVTISGVTSDCQLVIGSLNTGETRFYFNDIVVTIKSLSEPGLVASVEAVSSCTATFFWTHQGYTADEDIAKPYRYALYRDAACTDLVVSFESTAGADCWYGNTPCFVFGGLQPSTQYWFQVTDTENAKVSDPVSATTESFTVVDATTVKDAAVGDVLLAEDFSEIGAGPDELAEAAGFVPSSKVLPVSPSGENPEGGFASYRTSSGPYGDRIFGAGWNLGESRISKGWGFFGNSACYYGAGSLRLATSTGRTHIVTPALSGIPEGKVAKIEVTVTAAKYESNANDIGVFAEKGLTMDDTTDPASGSYKKYTGALLEDGYGLGITSVKEWETKSVTISKVDSECHLLIGSLEDLSGKNRVYIRDVTVTITELIDDPSMMIKDEATFLGFVSAVAAGDKTLEAKLTSSFEVSAAAAEAFASIEGFEGTLDGGGKTITGLTKPLFNDLKGTVKDLTLNSTLNITADQADLGILANVLSGTVDGCTSQGSVTFNVDGGVTGEHRIGGLIGSAAASGAVVTDCTNEASVTNETTNTTDGELIIGGVLGIFWGTQFSISACANTGAVTNNAYWEKAISVGGIVGQAGNGSSASSDLSVSDCTNIGAVSNTGNSASSNNVGGIIGWIRFGTYSGNSNDGDISNSGVAPNNYIGGVIGYLDKNATFMNNSNSGLVSNSGDATASQCIGGILGYIGTGNKISDAGSSAKYKLTNSGDIGNSGSAKNIFIGGLFGRNSSGYFNMTGTSGVYSTNSGDITDTSGPGKSSGGDICIGGIAGYTTTGIKTQYARNSGDIYVTGDKGSTNINAGGIGGWISNASFNFNNCRNTGNVTMDCTTTASIWAAGIVGCPKNNNTVHYYWYSNAVIDTHAATVGGENYTAGLMGTHEGSYSASYTTFTMYGHKLAGTVWGSKSTTGLFCCTKNAAYTFDFQGGTGHPNTIAPGTVRKDNTHDDTVTTIDDVNVGILAGGAGSSADVPAAIESGNIVVAEW